MPASLRLSVYLMDPQVHKLIALAPKFVNYTHLIWNEDTKINRYQNTREFLAGKNIGEKDFDKIMQGLYLDQLPVPSTKMGGKSVIAVVVKDDR